MVARVHVNIPRVPDESILGDCQKDSSRTGGFRGVGANQTKSMELVNGSNPKSRPNHSN